MRPREARGLPARHNEQEPHPRPSRIRERPRRTSWYGRLALGTCLLVGATALLGRTLSEVNRIWLFFVPAIVLVAAHALRRIAGPRAEPAWIAVVALQVGWAMVLKCYEGFPSAP